MDNKYQIAANETVITLVQQDGLDSSKLQRGEYSFICTPSDYNFKQMRDKLPGSKRKTYRSHLASLESYLKGLIGKYYGNYAPMETQEYCKMVEDLRKVCPVARCCRTENELVKVLADYYAHRMNGCCLNGIEYRGIYWLMGTLL